MTSLWSPVKVGKLNLKHRLALAPMTRSRANPDGTPGADAAEYYAQRASLGLLITEGTQPSEDGQGYMTTPGIYTDAHVKGWKKVTDAVHQAGGHVFMQIMHAGRVAHPDNTPHHRTPVAPSAVTPKGEIFTPKGMQPYGTPRALMHHEVTQTVKDFAHAAKRAIEAGADGVEIHGANGYLVHQFLAPAPTTAMTNMAARPKTARALPSKWPRRWSPKSAPTRSVSASRRSTASRQCRKPSRKWLIPTSIW